MRDGETDEVSVGQTSPATRSITVVRGAATVLVLTAIIFPRAAAGVFVVAMLAILSLLARDHSRARLLVSAPPVVLWLLALCLWSMITALWSPVPVSSLTKPLFLLGAVLAAALLPLIIERSDPALCRAATNGIIIATLIGGALVAFESLTQQALSRFVMNMIPFLRRGLEKHVSLNGEMVIALSDANLKRRCTVVTLLVFPVGHLLTQIDGDMRRRAGLAALATIAAVILMFSGHQSSQVALVASTLVFLLALASRRWAVRGVVIAWIFAVVLAVPLVIWAHASGLYAAKWLPTSAQHRVVIWNTTAEKILKAPLLGIGADATAAVTRQEDASSGPRVKAGAYEATTARHAHNAYLQVWYELGLVGVAIFLAAGVAALRAVGSVPGAQLPYFLAQFTVFAALIAFSFSIWQVWFQAAIGLGVVTLLASAALQRSTHSSG
jgi:O-antigen ligase